MTSAGLTLTRDLPWLAATSLDWIKVSLHYFSDESIAAIAEGKPGDVAAIKAGIEAAVQVIPAVEIDLLLQPQNAHEVNDIIGYARWLGVGVQIIASDERAVTTGTGQGKRVFAVDPITIEVIDASLARHHVGECSTCPFRDRCTEGFWALRLDSAGTLSPCLFRPDPRLDITRNITDPAGFTAMVSAHLDAFTEGSL